MGKYLDTFYYSEMELFLKKYKMYKMFLYLHDT